MKFASKIYTFLLLPLFFTGFLILTGLNTENINSNDDPRWNTDPRTSPALYPSGTYSALPQSDNGWKQVQTEPRIIDSPLGSIIVSPNFRVHPSQGTQSEVPIVRHPLNPLIMFASANTFPGGSLISTGAYVTTNGGSSWYGNDTLITPSGTPVFNFGDPGPVIDKNGRFLISYITLGGSMGASYSTNNGLNFSSTVSFPGTGSSSDKNLSGTDDSPSSPYYGRSYTVFTEFSGSYTNRIVMSWTSDGGVSWSSISPVSPVPSSGHHHQGCDVRVGPNGEVYVAWTNCKTNGQNSTEDSLGFAVSLDGGVSWASSRSNASNMNGIRAFSLFNGLRMAGFPRIDVDRSGGQRNGWIYVTTVEKNIAPATDTSDVLVHRSTDGGNSWTVVRVNQDTPGNGKFQYQSAIRVDEYGGVNVVYYDTRNTPTNDSAEIYVSRSTDGGDTWSDILVSDHKFKPKAISGLAGGYQGDYIGITSGRGLLWPYWAEDITGIYQAWTSSVRVYSNTLNAFNMISPAAGITIQTLPNSSSTFSFNWDTSAYTATYKWVFGSPSISQRKITFSLNTNSLTLNGGQLDSILSSLGLNQGDSLIGQWDVWAYRNNTANDSLISANGSRAIILKRSSPSLTPFQLFSPLNNVRISVLGSNTSPQYFKWRKSGLGVNFKLFYAVPNFSSQSNIKFSFPSNNNGLDTVLTMRNSQIDSLIASFGIAYSDSSIGQWKVYAYNGTDSLASTLTYNLTFKRGSAPVINTSVDSIAVDLPINQNTTRTLNISNTGQNPLGWVITELLSSNDKNELKSEMSDENSISWLDENPLSGTINSSGNQNVNIVFNSNGLNPNTSYTGELNIQSNDPLLPVKIIRVRLNVGPLGIQNNLSNNIPDVYELRQNFPNPFNPSTKINYALPKEGSVMLKVFDILGKEVAVLVNEYKPAGYYELEFDASAFASGLYFYSIESLNYKETRRMLLVK